MSDNDRIKQMIAEARDKFDTAMSHALFELIDGVVFPGASSREPVDRRGTRTPQQAASIYSAHRREIICATECLQRELARLDNPDVHVESQSDAYAACLRRCRVGVSELAAVFALADVGARVAQLMESPGWRGDSREANCDDEGRAESVARVQRVTDEFASANSSDAALAGDLFALMLEYQRLMNKEHREELAAIRREKERLCEMKLALVSYNDWAKGVLGDELNGLNELGELESLRLQMAMDRISRVSLVLSNLLKNISETSSGVTDHR